MHMRLVGRSSEKIPRFGVCVGWFLSSSHYNITMMADLELFPKKPDEDDIKVEEKPKKKRKYKKDKPLEVKSIDVVKGVIYVEFWVIHAGTVHCNFRATARRYVARLLMKTKKERL